MAELASFIVSCIYYQMARGKSGKNTSKRTVTSSQQVKKSVRSCKEASPLSSPQSSPPAVVSRNTKVSEYACRLRLIVSQTQVDFKAGEYVDPAYITYIQG